MDVSRTHWINPVEGNSLAKIAKSYASVRACIGVLMQHVFEFPIETSGALSADAIRNLAQLVLHDAIVYGVSVVVVNKRQPPVHVPWNAYRIGIVQKIAQFKRTYKIVHAHNMQDIPGAIVLSTASRQSQPITES